MNKIFALNQTLRESQNVVLYGAGYLGKRTYDFLIQNKIRIKYFCDSMKYGSKTIEGVEIIAPESLLKFSDLCVVITVAKAWIEIYDKLLKLGIPKENIISHIGLNNLCIINIELLQGKKIFVSGTGNESLWVLYQFLVHGMCIEGFLDEESAGGKLLNRNIYSKKTIKDWENTVVVVQPLEIQETFPNETIIGIDNSFKGSLGKDIYVGYEKISIMLLHELKRFKGDRKLVIYGTGEYALKCYKILQMLGYEIAFFVSLTEIKTQIERKQVVSIYDLIYQPEEYYIYVCVKPVDYEKVTYELKSLGYRELYDYAPAWERGLDRIYDPHLGYICITVESGKDYNGFYTVPANSDTKEYRILILGGSTSDPWCTPVKLWCQFLWEICQEHGYNVEIIIGGTMGYASAQELEKLVRDGINLNVDLVISYSGANDIFDRGEYPFLNLFQLDTCTIFDNKEKGLKSSRGLKRRNVDPYYEWIQNERMMHGILNEFQIPFLAVYQPVLWSKGGKKYIDEITKEKMHRSTIVDIEGYEMAIKNANSARAKIKYDAENIEWIYDFTTIFDNEPEVYVDVVHCTEKGNRIIAEKMFGLLEKYLQ
ncbi:MAG: hypothetical protein NC489_15150 [Ruminococcus flavefaciens]|nr:hypothetical protein [Roseburia sp.]MCM1231455.1 hypothetical protein [Ruminococcus flavefaciens]